MREEVLIVLFRLGGIKLNIVVAFQGLRVLYTFEVYRNSQSIIKLLGFPYVSVFNMLIISGECKCGLDRVRSLLFECLLEGADHVLYYMLANLFLYV